MANAKTSFMLDTNDSATPATVTYLDERYVLGELLGAGAMGQVFAAHDVVLDIEVAVKVMHASHVSSRSMVARFAREASVGARMLSPHTAKVLGVAVTKDGAPCIVFERLEGETLRDRLDRTGGLSMSETVELVKQTARALGRAHRIGVVHRDVKPENIFLTRDAGGRMVVKLLDFGIAEVVDAGGAYARCQAAGTPEYMAPEILLGTHDLDVRADLYSLAVVAFECITGECPFQGELGEVLTLLQSGASPRFTERRPDLTGAVDAWMDRALHPDPYWRFASAKELADTFEQATRPAHAPGAQAERVARHEAA